MRPLCPICHRPADELRQVHPKYVWRACQDCCAQYAPPQEWGTPAWRLLSYEVRAAAVERETALRERMVKPMRFQPARRHIAVTERAYQINIPVCVRCGRVHERFLFATYAHYCQRCDDEFSVETILKFQTVRGMDDETFLDFLYQSPRWRELFDRGVLPDYFFKLKRQP